MEAGKSSRHVARTVFFWPLWPLAGGHRRWLLLRTSSYLKRLLTTSIGSSKNLFVLAHSCLLPTNLS